MDIIIKFVSTELHYLYVNLQLTTALYDKMTETVYTSPLLSFKSQDIKESWYEVDILGRGVEAMKEVNTKLGW